MSGSTTSLCFRALLIAAICAISPASFAQLAPTPAKAPEARSGTPAKASAEGRDPWLSELNQMLSRGEQPLEVHLSFGKVEHLSETQVAQGAAITQALALRAGSRPVHVSHGPQVESGKFNVLIGTADDLKNVLPPAEVGRIRLGHLSLRRLPQRPEGFLLVVSGPTLEDINNAIIGLGLIRERLPDASHAAIREVVLPAAVPFFRREPLASEGSTTFEQLQETGVGLTQLPGGGVALELHYPGYLPTQSDALVTLDLHFALKARPFQSGDALTVRLNGQDLNVGRAKVSVAASGGSESSIQFPVRFFQAGRNVLEISGGGKAGLGAANRDDLKVFADSTLTMPRIEGHPALPDLQLTSRTFFPFIGQPDGSNLSVALLDSQPETIDSAWTLLARLAQSANTFFYAAKVNFGVGDPGRHRLLIGNYAQLPLAYQRVATLSAFEPENVDIPVADIDRLVTGTNLKQVIERFMQRHTPAPKAQPTLDKPAADPTAFGIMAEVAPPNDEQGWVLIVTAHSSKTLLARTQSLVQPDFWDRIGGDMVRWGATPDSLESRVPGQGKTSHGMRSFVEMPLGERVGLKLWIGLVVAVLILAVVVSAKVLAKYDQMYVLRQRRPQ